ICSLDFLKNSDGYKIEPITVTYRTYTILRYEVDENRMTLEQDVPLLLSEGQQGKPPACLHPPDAATSGRPL
ncbi:MAG: hypothetical protein LBR82_10620, partial [Desulfovibrio sp.]|nr:hypothetical protein [Desulfovibrio sp.]